MGFIKRLPHDLVASFRSTLDEARGAALLVHVVDVSDPGWPAQREVTHAVLAELGAGDGPTLLVLNKADRLDTATRAELAHEHPEALVMSALEPADIVALHARIVAFFERGMVDAELFVPYHRQRLVHAIHESWRVVHEIHDAAGTHIFMRASPALVEDLRRALH